MQIDQLLPQARHTQAAEFTVSVPITSVNLLPRNPKRYALVISAPPGDVIWITFGKAAVVGQGLGLRVGAQPFTLTLPVHGSVIQGEINAISANGTQSLSGLEINGL